MEKQFRFELVDIELDPEIDESGEQFGEEQEDGEFVSEADPYLEVSDGEALEGRLGEGVERGDASLAAIAERTFARHPTRVSVIEFENEKLARRSTRCFKAVDIAPVTTVYQENTTAAGAKSVDRCSSIVMLNAARGQLLKLKTKESRARSTSTRKGPMGALTTETIDKAMTQRRRAGYAKPTIALYFFDPCSKTAGT